jgi:glutamyl-tRNA synthetase
MRLRLSWINQLRIENRNIKFWYWRKKKSMNKNVRTRFCPSPSGSLHIGGGRTAMYNWAYAKKHNGTFVVRIEDTDAERSTPESKQIILDSLRWLGLDWNEGVDVGGKYGPYVQSERKDIYKFYAEKLISEGKAYRCYCTETDLKNARDEWVKNNPKVGFKYPGTCKNKPQDPNRPHVVRFVAKREGTTEFVDKAYGKNCTPNSENQDWVIIRPDGLPLYNFGCVIDDALMKITICARGFDHFQNTICQKLMYDALGFEPPEFCHLGLIRGKDGEKLSKRHASVSVFEYRDNGFTPGALLNYLAKVGWGKGNAELFSMNEFVDMFDWSGCGNTDGKWDILKLNAIQYAHLKSQTLTSDEEYAHRVIPFLIKNGLTDINPKQVESVIPLVRTRSKTLIEAANELDPIFRKDIVVDKAAVEKLLTNDIKLTLANYRSWMHDLYTWSESSVKDATQAFIAINKLTLKDIGQPLRVCLTGRTNSPELFQVMAALGKDTTLTRIMKQVNA